MTVITTLITKHYCVLASDSRVSYANEPRDQWPADGPKLLPAPRWRGAMAYWGVASIRDTSWTTKDLLLDLMASAPEEQSAEVLAQKIAARLNDEFVDRKLTDHGLGIHFAAYERDVLDETVWIPELFVITSWKDTPEDHYSKIKTLQGFEVTRESYQLLRRHESQNPRWRCALDEQGLPENRRALHRALHEGDLMLLFNNGDPELFSSTPSNFKSSAEIREHSRLKGIEETHRVLARERIEEMTRIQEQLPEDKQVIGGTTHDLTIAPDGTIHAHCSACGEPRLQREGMST